MCKSNQYQSIPFLFNLTISRKKNQKRPMFFFLIYLFVLASIKILPKDGLI